MLPDAPSVAEATAAHDNPGMTPKIRARRLLDQGKRIQRWRLDKGWNRTTLARKAGVTVTTIRGCETGTTVTQPDKLRAIVTALGKSLKHLEADDTQDQRVQHWTTEDYEIGNWYHNAPRAVKNWIWALQEHPQAAAAAAFGDPQFLRLLADWPHLNQWDRSWLMLALEQVKKTPQQPEGGRDAVAPAALEPKIRGPQR